MFYRIAGSLIVSALHASVVWAWEAPSWAVVAIFLSVFEINLVYYSLVEHLKK